MPASKKTVVNFAFPIVHCLYLQPDHFGGFRREMLIFRLCPSLKIVLPYI